MEDMGGRGACELHIVQFPGLRVCNESLEECKLWDENFDAKSLTFSTTCGNALRGIGSARLRFLTLDRSKQMTNMATGKTNLGVDVEGTAAASAAALASP